MPRAWAATHQGHVRGHNEDYYATSSSEAEANAPLWTGTINLQTGWALIADGMGGHAAGEVASLLAVKCLSFLMETADTEGAVRQSLQATNLALFDAMQQRPDLAGMGTTVAGIRFLGGEAVCFNVGDSRVYLSHTGGLRQVSEDHAVDGHALTQCLGGWSSEPLRPAVSILPLVPSSRILLCTDGLTNMVADERISEFVRSPDPAAKLIEAALAAGGADNATVVVIEVS